MDKSKRRKHGWNPHKDIIIYKVNFPQRNKSWKREISTKQYDKWSSVLFYK